MTLTALGFHPLIAQWFETEFNAPTDIQQQAWPEIVQGNHVLVSAPTGSGKTLTAFLWALNQLLTNRWEGGQTRVVYISPLKALNNDVRRNLRIPLQAITDLFRREEAPVYPVTVLTRSGDTPQNERRRMIRKPPEILITTPESLNILVSSRSGQQMLQGVRAVILDEIHGVISTKRGVHLMTAVDRMVPICGEFQRIALSATIRPLSRIALFVGGYEITGDPKHPAYHARAVHLIRTTMEKQMTVSVRFPDRDEHTHTSPSIWPALIAECKSVIAGNNAALFFANSRRLAEKTARLINENEPHVLAYAHHGSLSREIRLSVEEKLKNGQLNAIVATNSLELGIDIGNLDQVVLIQTPPSVSSAIQRIGRSGHEVGGVSRGLLFPMHGKDILTAGVLASLVHAKDIEAARPVESPLDMLAQMILAMTGTKTWDMDELFAQIRTSTAFHHVKRRHFDLVIDMLAGRFADTRLKELNPRVIIDRVDNTIQAKSGMISLIYMSGGTIPDRGYYTMRLENTRTAVGELDEEFVWERRVGETFSLGTQTWRIRQISPNHMDVVPAAEEPGTIPFWRAEARNRDFHFSEHIGRVLEFADPLIGQNDAKLADFLQTDCFMAFTAAQRLISFLALQKSITHTPLPHRHHLVIEHFDDAQNRKDSKQVVLHTFWGGRINRPFAMALSAAMEETYHYPLEFFADDDAVLLLLPHQFDTDMLFTLVTPNTIEELLRKKLEKTGYFGAMFRENAGRALLLPRQGFKKRMPLWLNRLRAKKLMSAVMNAAEFPILLETFRSCIRDDFDLENLKSLLWELATGEIRVSHATTFQASPFCGNLLFQQTNKYMYEDDTPDSGKTSDLPLTLLKDILKDADILGAIPLSLGHRLNQKLQRTLPGYAPGSPEDLLDWIRERFLLPEDEWEILIRAIRRDHGLDTRAILPPIDHKLVWVSCPGSTVRSIAAVENLPKIQAALSIPSGDLLLYPAGPEKKRITKKTRDAIEIIRNMQTEALESNGEDADDPALLISQWLSYYGPMPVERLTQVFGLPQAAVEPVVQSLIHGDRIISDTFFQARTDMVCDRDNLEILLRMARAERKPTFTPMEPNDLFLFMAAFQGLTNKGETPDHMKERLDQLFGLPLLAEAWEESIFPSRLSPYYASFLDALMQTSGLTWMGVGRKKIAFLFQEDMDLFTPDPETEDTDNSFLPEPFRPYSFMEIITHTGLDSKEATRKIWDQVWEGRLFNDTFEVLRKGILNRFSPESSPPGNHTQRGRFNRWKSSRPFAGNWYAAAPPGKTDDPLDHQEIEKERVRQLFRRYGVLFREVLMKEMRPLSWGPLFKTLRLMELSGEIMSGHFFKGLPGLQFISHEALRFLKTPLPDDAVYWMNAQDPASLCGVKLPAAFQALPPRLYTTHLTFHGRSLVLVSRKNGREVDIYVSHDHPHLHRYLEVFKMLVTREFNPRRVVRIETINNEKARESAYGLTLKAFGFIGDYKGWELRKTY